MACCRRRPRCRGPPLCAATAALLVLAVVQCASAAAAAPAAPALTGRTNNAAAALRGPGRELLATGASAVAEARAYAWRSFLADLLQSVVNYIQKPFLVAAAGGPVDQAAPVAAAPAVAAAGGGLQQLAGPAPPVAVVQLPQAQPAGNGINLDTSTPVNIGAPITVDTPVKQVNTQFGLGGGRRLLSRGAARLV